MKQTAVEFYRNNLMALVSTGKTDFKTEPEIFEQAKEIEKEQRIDCLKTLLFDISQGKDVENIEQYYNETFKNTKQ